MENKRIQLRNELRLAKQLISKFTESESLLAKEIYEDRLRKLHSITESDFNHHWHYLGFKNFLYNETRINQRNLTLYFLDQSQDKWYLKTLDELERAIEWLRAEC